MLEWQFATTMSSDAATTASISKTARDNNARGGGDGVFFFIGASHRTTPLEMREKLALTEDKLPALQARLDAIRGLLGHVVLNTCNRVEIYGLASVNAGAYPSGDEGAFFGVRRQSEAATPLSPAKIIRKLPKAVPPVAPLPPPPRSKAPPPSPSSTCPR